MTFIFLMVVMEKVMNRRDKLTSSKDFGKDISVQKTNDFSSVSKLSMCDAGYMEDSYLQFFVSKRKRRAPIINRGYFIRMHAIDNLLRKFFKAVGKAEDGSTRKANIILLGAGFDTLYFRLKDTYESWSDAVDYSFIEFDFESVCRNKVRMIQAEPSMTALLDSDTTFNLSDSDPSDESELKPILRSKRYTIFGLDMRNVDQFQKAFHQLNTDLNLPTLIVAEVVLSYIDHDHVMKIVSAFRSQFSCAVFARYEQILPNDGFGRFMMRHFKEQNAPLINVLRTRSIDDQKEEYRTCGWKDVAVISMSTYWSSLDTEEIHRISLLEPFDEYEEFTEKCRHYVLSLASSGSLHSFIELYDAAPTVDTCSIVPLPIMTPEAAGTLPLLYGHAQAVIQLPSTNGESLPRKLIVMVGGVSRFPFKNARSGELEIFFLDGKYECVWMPSEMLDSSFKRPLVHHSVFNPGKCLPGRICVFGGRTSPNSENGKIFLIDFIAGSGPNSVKFTVEMSNIQKVHAGCSSGPESQFLRSQTCQISLSHESKTEISLITLQDYKCVMGLLTASGSGDGCYSLELSNCELLEGNGLGSIAAWKHFGIVSGGYDRVHGKAVAGVCRYDPGDKSLTHYACLEHPRFGHTSHVWNNLLILVGGTSHQDVSLPAVSVLDLETKAQRHYNLTFRRKGDDENPVVMLFNHASTLLESEGLIVVTGGGGNCFSFGSHFNAYPIIIVCNRLLE